MDLNLHIGAEKTGSSHIQTLAARGREQLVNKSLCVPQGWPHDERCMAAGQISAGNGRLLASAISNSPQREQEERLRDCVQSARSSGCKRVLLTSEHLLPCVSLEGRLATLEAAASETGFATTRYFILLREPVSQCLSLYKHRAKRGTAGEIAEWVRTGYRLPEELKRFREQAEQLGVTPTVRGYTRNPGGLEKAFFEDWLGVATPSVATPSTVNPSLTLSELILIKQMAARRPALVTPLYDALVAVDPADKLQGEAMEAHAQAVATAAAAEHAEEWAAWNRLLPSNEALTIPTPPDEIPPRPTELGFSDPQMATIAAVIDEAASSRFVARTVWRSQIRPLLSRFKHGWRLRSSR